MGLDMYLTRETYIKNWEHNPPERQYDVQITRGDGVKLNLVRPREIVEEVGYWRKANAIHAWFVREVQDGVDNCQKAEVSEEDLKRLFATVNEVLDDPSKAMTLLPPQAGFFFGSTEVNEWYLEDLKRTLEIVGGVLETTNFSESTIYYESSW